MTDPRDPTRGSTAPDRYWTCTNVSEATPEVLSPLGWSLWIPNTELATRRAWADFGIMARSEVRLPQDPDEFVVSAFYGRQALNVDRVCHLMGSLPGTSPADVERDICGSVRPGVSVRPRSGWRIPVVAARAPAVVATQAARVRRLHRAQLAWWQDEVLHAGGPPDPRDGLAGSALRFRRGMHIHARARFLCQALQSQVRALAGAAGRPELEHSLFAGFGQVTETGIADDLWLLSRGQLTLDGFVTRHGFHGTNEGNVIGVSWRQDPAPVEAMAKSMAARPDGERPRLREAAAMAARSEAEAVLLGALTRAKRPAARLTLHLAGACVRHLELTKAAFLMAIDGTRAAAVSLGEHLAGDGHLDEPGDAVYLTIPELVDGPPPDARALCAYRRERREQYRRVVLPLTFTGMPEPRPATAGPLPAEVPPAAARLVGLPGSVGVAEGMARVAEEVDDAVALQPGEILVCRVTDPSWAAIMVLADALVIDIGGPASHGAIVARELGIPCVIGTGDGTTRIRTGDRLRVDGGAGTVDVLGRDGAYRAGMPDCDDAPPVTPGEGVSHRNIPTAQPNPRLERLKEVLRERQPEPGAPIGELRAQFEAGAARMPLAEGVAVEAGVLAGRVAEWLRPPGADATVLYLHGGGYVMGSCSTIRPLASHLALSSRGTVVTLDYRLGPEHPHPAARDDAVAAYLELLGGVGDPRRVAVAGDSAGGGLTVACLVALRDGDAPLPVAAVCISPWADLTLATSAARAGQAEDPQVTALSLDEMVRAYLGGQDPKQPSASPVFADLRGLPPLLIQVGAAEALLDDAITLANSAAGAGVDVTLECWEHMIHVWHAFAPGLPEASEAIEGAAAWLRQRLDGGGTDLRKR